MRMRLLILREEARYRLQRAEENFMRWLAQRVPRRLRYFVLIDCGVQAIKPTEEVPAVRYTEVLQRTPAR